MTVTNLKVAGRQFVVIPASDFRHLQRKAARLLEDQDAGKDLSDLVEELLGKWISENLHA